MLRNLLFCCLLVLVFSQGAPISPYRIHENTIYTSGQLGVLNGTLLRTFAEQTEQTIINLNNVLKSAGSNLKNVLKTTVFLADMKYYSEMNQIYSKFFRPPYPARSAFAVKELPLKGLIEIECIATCHHDDLQSKMFVYFLHLLLIVVVTSNQVTNIGDSWGTGGFSRFQENVRTKSLTKKVLKYHPNYKVTRYAKGGSTARYWLSNEGQSTIQKMFQENKNLTHVWYSLGGNGKPKEIYLNYIEDVRAYASRGQIIQFPSFFMNETRRIIQSLIRRNPNIKVASLGYDIMSTDRSEACKSDIKKFFPGPLFLFRTFFVETFKSIFSQIEKDFPNNFVYIPVWGTLQRAAGNIPNPPNYFYCSPAKYYKDCVHPNDEGYSILMKEFVSKLKERRFF